jgi:hypothetical protein
MLYPCFYSCFLLSVYFANCNRTALLMRTTYGLLLSYTKPVLNDILNQVLNRSRTTSRAIKLVEPLHRIIYSALPEVTALSFIILAVLSSALHTILSSQLSKLSHRKKKAWCRISLFSIATCSTVVIIFLRPVSIGALPWHAYFPVNHHGSSGFGGHLLYG